MTDPLTAVGAASACLELAVAAAAVVMQIAKFCIDTRKVNETVNNLVKQIKCLGSACDLIQQELITVAKGQWSATYDEDGSLSKAVRTEVDACRQTINTLKGVVDKIERRHRLDKLQRQFQLMWSKDSIEDFRLRISTHTQALQMVLQVVNMRISYIAPGHANQDLMKKLDTMQVDLKHILGVDKEDEQSGQTISMELVQCTQDTLTSGTTLYQGSVSGSVKGGQDAASKNHMVVAWASSIASLRSEFNPTDDSDVAVKSPSAAALTARDSMVNLPDREVSVTGQESPHGALVLSDYDGESADEDAIDNIEAAVREGTLAFERQNWEHATLLFQESLADLKRVSMKRREVCDVLELNYKLVMCAYHTNETPQAIEVLVDFVSQQPSSDLHRRRMCDARHLLSQLYIKAGLPELALDACEKALKARRRLLGKEDALHSESLALMAKIYNLQGDSVRASIYIARIPQTHILAGLGVDQTSCSSVRKDSALKGPPKGSTSAIEEATKPSRKIEATLTSQIPGRDVVPKLASLVSQNSASPAMACDTIQTGPSVVKVHSPDIKASHDPDCAPCPTPMVSNSSMVQVSKNLMLPVGVSATKDRAPDINKATSSLPSLLAPESRGSPTQTTDTVDTPRRISANDKATRAKATNGLNIMYEKTVQPKCADLSIRKKIMSYALQEDYKIGAISLAILNKELDAALQLIKTPGKGRDVLVNALAFAACFGDLDIVTALIERGAARHELLFSTNVRYFPKSYFQMSPLELAYAYRWPDVFRVLVKYRSPENDWHYHTLFSTNSLSMRPCKTARDIITMLSKIPDSPPPDFTRTVVWLLYSNYSTDSVYASVFEYLLGRQPDVLCGVRGYIDNKGCNSLQDAILRRHDQFVPRLLEDKAHEQLRLKNHDGFDALLLGLRRLADACLPTMIPQAIQLAKRQDRDLIAVLLKAGASTNTQVVMQQTQLRPHLKAVVDVGTPQRKVSVSVTATQMAEAVGDVKLIALLAMYP